MALTMAATPLGNPLDASPRLKDAIVDAEIIAAEDSRRFHRLCADIGVTFTGKVISFFDGNETERSEEILQYLRSGKNVLVVVEMNTRVQFFQLQMEDLFFLWLLHLMMEMFLEIMEVKMLGL